MYEFLAPIVGFHYKVYEYKSFEKALAKVKEEIDAGYPCMIGALDMFYLPHFEKLYHKEHILFHYELATGYDDEAQILYFVDCGRTNTQMIPYDELRLAFHCSYLGLSKPNTVWAIRMQTSKDKYEIAKEAFAKKKELYLDPHVGFIGYRGFENSLRIYLIGKMNYQKMTTTKYCIIWCSFSELSLRSQINCVVLMKLPLWSFVVVLIRLPSFCLTLEKSITTQA